MWTRTHTCKLLPRCHLILLLNFALIRRLNISDCPSLRQFSYSSMHYCHHLCPLFCISGSLAPRRQVAKRWENIGIWKEETETQHKTPIGKAAIQAQQQLDLFNLSISTRIMLKSAIIQAAPSPAAGI